MAVNTGLKCAFSFLLENVNGVLGLVFDFCFVDLFVSAFSRP